MAEEGEPLRRNAVLADAHFDRIPWHQADRDEGDDISAMNVGTVSARRRRK